MIGEFQSICTGYILIPIAFIKYIIKNQFTFDAMVKKLWVGRKPCMKDEIEVVVQRYRPIIDRFDSWMTVMLEKF